jgi:hypothetical protein
MTVALALLQAGQIEDKSMIYILGVVTLLVLIALGLKFWRNMFEIITAPTASIGYHGQNDNVFFSLVIVVLGGLIGTFILINAQSEMTQGFHTWAAAFADQAAQSGTSKTYQDVASTWGMNKLDATFSNYFVSNLAMFPALQVLSWLLVGFLAFLGAKMFGGHTTYSTMLGSFAYAYFFLAIGQAAYTVASFGNLKMVAALATGGMGDFSGMNMLWMTVGLVLSLYGIILWFIALAQGGQLTAGGIIGVLVLLLVVNGGINALIIYKGVMPWTTELVKDIKSIDPSKPNYKLPD